VNLKVGTFENSLRLPARCVRPSHDYYYTLLTLFFIVKRIIIAVIKYNNIIQCVTRFSQKTTKLLRLLSLDSKIFNPSYGRKQYKVRRINLYLPILFVFIFVVLLLLCVTWREYRLSRTGLIIIIKKPQSFGCSERFKK